MSVTDRIATPGAPTTGTPPTTVDSALRTERHDLIFVGHPWQTRVWKPLVRNAPAPAFHVERAADVPPAVAAYAARRWANEQYPYIWLAPELAREFEDLATEALVRQYALPPSTGGVWVDFTASDAAQAAHQRDLDAGAPGWQASGQAVDAASDAAIDRAQADLGDAWDELLETLICEMCTRPDFWPERHGTLTLVLEAGCRVEVRAALHDHKRWSVLLRAEPAEEARLRRRGEPHLRTAGGLPVRDEAELKAQSDPLALQVALARVFDFMRRWHDEHQRADDLPDCIGFPSEQTVARWAREQRFRDPEPTTPTTPAPEARLADQVAEAVDELFHRPRAHPEGPTAEQVRRRVRRSRDLVEATLEWLARQGRVERSPRGAHGRVGWLPPVEDR